MKRYVLLFSLLMGSQIYSQDSTIVKAPPSVKTMVGIYGNGVVESKDGGIIVAGWIKYQSPEYRDHDLWVIKADESGNEVWQKRFGGRSTDRANGLINTENGGILIVGETYSFGKGTYDFWGIRMDNNGDVLWHKTYGAKGVDRGFAVTKSPDKGFALAGFTESIGAGASDGWLVTIDASGEKKWSKPYGGKGLDRFTAVSSTKDNGYFLAGYTTTQSKGGLDIWIVLVDAQGKIKWEKSWGGKGDDRALGILSLQDGTFLAVGGTYSKGEGKEDVVCLKLNASGEILWEKTLGGKLPDSGNAVAETFDGGFIVAGHTESKGNGYSDGWLVRLDKNGEKLWDKTFGGKTTDKFKSVKQLRDGGFIISGLSKSTGYRETDVWVIKTDSLGNVIWKQVFKEKEDE